MLLHAKRSQQRLVIHDGLVGVHDRTIEDDAQRRGRQAAQFLGRYPALLAQGPHCGRNERADRQVCNRSLLDVEESDLDRVALEPCDRAAGVEPLVLQDAIGVQRGDVAEHRFEDLGPVGRRGVDGLWDHVANDRTDTALVFGVDGQPRVQLARPASFHHRGTCRQRREQREQRSDRSVKFPELLGATKWQVEVAALEISPTVPTASERTVVGGVHFAAVVRPQPRLGRWVHRRVHRRRKESSSHVIGDGVQLL